MQFQPASICGKKPVEVKGILDVNSWIHGEKPKRSSENREKMGKKL
jgi:hypothetical protein